MPEFDKTYDPRDVEERWYRRWDEAGLFRADEESDRRPFCIVIPPPNVTGVLHMGHALNNTLQDISVRWRRMRGDNALWVPGMDHAGIATQNVVEKQLAGEGTDRHRVGREDFVRRVWAWKEHSGGEIINQLKRLGCSCDWSRERFTLDEGLSRAVRRVFISLFEEGLIFRDEKIINWCPRCHTALSDLEVENEDSPGALYYVRYPFVDGGGGVTVATTRPETIPGDTAVAVHPGDDRYASLVGRVVRLPVEPFREVPVIADEAVDPAFGTGALKITPAHDAADFEIGRRHGLASVTVIDPRGIMNEGAGPRQGLERFAARENIVEALREGGLLEKTADYAVPLGHCYRCKNVVEPALSPQWFVRVGPLAEPAVEAVRSRRTRIIPEHWEKTYFDWMENIRDWCISRQIWWGHQIPAWYCLSCDGERIQGAGESEESPRRIGIDAVPIVADVRPAACPRCGGGELVQDPDVLDTWFSSALWPFTTLGWPEETKLLDVFYPTSLLVTGFDILFFWVARMMMMGLKFRGDVPFRDVYIHAMVRDSQGQKMSKSKGNVIDPLGVMDRFGTDAFRFTLAAMAAQGRDIKLSEERIAGYRNFVTKLWNASRFVAMNLAGEGGEGEPPAPRTLEDRWILSRLNDLSLRVNRALEAYRYNEAASALYRFTWHEYCDWYLEIIKPRLSGEKADGDGARGIAAHALRVLLRLLHPIMPFVTEEIHHRLGGSGMLMSAAFPVGEPGGGDEEAERQMVLIIETVNAARTIRGEMNLPPSREIRVVLRKLDPGAAALLKGVADTIGRLTRAAAVDFEAAEPPKKAATAPLSFGEISVPLEGLVDFSEELRRLDKDAGRVAADIERIERKLANPDFVDRAPAAVVEKDRGRLAECREKIEVIDRSRERVRSWIGEER